jgi:IS5 family transposase
VFQADRLQLLSDEHFTVDGTLIEAAASLKSFRPKDEPPDQGTGSVDDNPNNRWVDFHGEKRSNATHQSRTDPDARLYKKARGREARLGYLGHVLMEHRSGLIVNATVTAADGYGERDAAVAMIRGLGRRRRITVAADKAYDTRDFVAHLRAMDATPHVAQYTVSAHRGSAIDRRTTRHAGYAISQQKRKLVEQGFGWMKTVGGLRKLRHRGGPLVTWIFTFTAAAYNIVRLRRLLPATA